MGTPRPRNRSRTSGTSGYSWMLWPRLSRTVPSLETARVRSAPAEPRLAPGLPSPASPVLVERGVYVRVHPERPERVICEREKMRVSQPARAQGLESSYWALEKYCALRNFPQPGPSPRSKTASLGSRAMILGNFLRNTGTASPDIGDGQGSLACCSLWGHKKSDMTERLK